MVSPALVPLFVSLVAMAAGSAYDIGPDVYNELLMQDLYKQLAGQADPIAPNYYYDDDTVQVPKEPWMDSRETPIETRDSGAADLRDQESIEQGSHGDGFQYISGGAGEGVQHLTPEGKEMNQQEVKTDEHLPFYCHPPNPCPKGFKAEQGCDEGVEDTDEYQRKYIWEAMKRGMCNCDEEHMFKCPKPAANADPKNSMQNDISAMFNDYFPQSIEDIGSLLEQKRAEAKREDSNPYLGGYKLSRAAKKGLGYN